ncbi:MAG: hypothetical protein IJY37_06835 [Clostridia bacterium]|nr:hypothetical protein [Clostridia bacterium]MBP3555622.1 hypothetical protein [Clostridia bacterium]MBQ8420048.1 hypothetical protein [Clostridia bacterium]
MKESFTEAVVEILIFEKADVLTTSTAPELPFIPFTPYFIWEEEALSYAEKTE